MWSLSRAAIRVRTRAPHMSRLAGPARIPRRVLVPMAGATPTTATAQAATAAAATPSSSSSPSRGLRTHAPLLHGRHRHDGEHDDEHDHAAEQQERRSTGAFDPKTWLARISRLWSPSASSSQAAPTAAHEHDDEHEHEHHPAPAPTAAAQAHARWSKDKEITNITIVGMASNIGLAGVKGVAGVFGNSVAMVADALHSVSDLLTDVVTLWASKMSLRPRSSVHPYGHGKFESVGALAISALLVGTAGGMVWHSVDSLRSILASTSLESPTSLALWGAVVSIVVKEIIFHRTMQVGKKYNSSVVKANAWHHRTDSISSLVALIGVGGSMLSVPIVDPLAGLVVSVMIGKAGAELGWDSICDLTDRSVGVTFLRKVDRVLESMKADGVRSYHELRGRRMGASTILDVHICVAPHLSVSASHQIAELVRVRVLEALPTVSEILVHVDVDDAHGHEHGGELGHQPLPKFAGAQEHSSAVPLKAAPPAPPSPTPSPSPSPTAETAAPTAAAAPSLHSSALFRSPTAIETDVRRALSEAKQREPWGAQLLALTHFTSHYFGRRVSVQIDVVLDSSLTIAQAMELASVLERVVMERVQGVDAVDVHLELNPQDVERAQQCERAQLRVVDRQ